VFDGFVGMIGAGDTVDSFINDIDCWTNGITVEIKIMSV